MAADPSIDIREIAQKDPISNSPRLQEVFAFEGSGQKTLFEQLWGMGGFDKKDFGDLWNQKKFVEGRDALLGKAPKADDAQAQKQDGDANTPPVQEQDVQLDPQQHLQLLVDSMEPGARQELEQRLGSLLKEPMESGRVDLGELAKDPDKFLEEYRSKLTEQNQPFFDKGMDEFTKIKADDYDPDAVDTIEPSEQAHAFLALAIGSGEAGRIHVYLEQRGVGSTLAGNGLKKGDDEDLDQRRMMAREMMLANVNRIASEVIEIDRQLSGLYAEQQQLTEDIERLKTEITGLKAEKEKVDDRVSDLEQQAARQDDAVARAQEKLDRVHREQVQAPAEYHKAEADLLKDDQGNTYAFNIDPETGQPARDENGRIIIGVRDGENFTAIKHEDNPELVDRLGNIIENTPEGQALVQQQRKVIGLGDKAAEAVDELTAAQRERERIQGDLDTARTEQTRLADAIAGKESELKLKTESLGEVNRDIADLEAERAEKIASMSPEERAEFDKVYATRQADLVAGLNPAEKEAYDQFLKDRDAAEQKIDEQQAEKTSVDENVTKLEGELAAINAEIAKLEGRNKELENENTELRARDSQLTNEIENLNQQIATQQGRVEDAERSQDDLNQRIAQSQVERAATVTEMEENSVRDDQGRMIFKDGDHYVYQENDIPHRLNAEESAAIEQKLEQNPDLKTYDPYEYNRAQQSGLGDVEAQSEAAANITRKQRSVGDLITERDAKITEQQTIRTQMQANDQEINTNNEKLGQYYQQANKLNAEKIQSELQRDDLSDDQRQLLEQKAQLLGTQVDLAAQDEALNKQIQELETKISELEGQQQEAQDNLDKSKEAETTAIATAEDVQDRRLTNWNGQTVDVHEDQPITVFGVTVGHRMSYEDENGNVQEHGDIASVAGGVAHAWQDFWKGDAQTGQQVNEANENAKAATETRAADEQTLNQTTAELEATRQSLHQVQTQQALENAPNQQLVNGLDADAGTPEAQTEQTQEANGGPRTGTSYVANDGNGIPADDSPTSSFNTAADPSQPAPETEKAPAPDQVAEVDPAAQQQQTAYNPAQHGFT